MIKEITQTDIKYVASRYIKFPLYTFWGSLFNLLSVNISNMLISRTFTVETLGFFALSYRVLTLPIAIIGRSVSQVYIQEASKELKETGKANIVFFNTIKKMLLVGVPVFLILFIFSEIVFGAIFGNEWKLAGKYAEIVSPLLLVRFVMEPVSVTFSVFVKEQFSLLWQLGLFLMSLASFGIVIFFKFDFEEFLFTYTYLLIFTYSVLFIILTKIVKGAQNE